MTKPTYQIVSLSESTDFLPINVVSITDATPDLIHTVTGTVNNYDELWLDAYNYGSVDALLTICYDGISSYQKMKVPVPASRGLIPILKGLRFNNGVEIKAYASIANTISVVGSVNRIVFI